MMLLAVDIGNTNIEFGIFKQTKLLFKKKVPTKIARSLDKCNREIYNLPHRDGIKDIIISSVVPDALKGLERVLKRVFNKKNILVLGKDIQAPIKNLYKRPEQVGQDRLANAVAAAYLYNRDKKRPLVVIDFGTAVTFDIISRKNEYLGGLIFPGIRLSLENLTKRAALLPKKIEIKRPPSVIGRDTKNSIRSGILNGYGSLCDGVVQKIGSFFGTKVKVVATGGDAGLIAKYAHSIKKVDPNLTLKGLRISFSNQVRSEKPV